MFLDMGVNENNKSDDVLQGVQEKTETGGRNHGFINSTNT